MTRCIILCMCSLFYLSFLGCFDDEGNYTYDKLNSPVWLENRIFLFGTQGEMIEFKGHDAYRWQKDSVERESKVRFEWKLYDVVISDKADFQMPTDSLIKIIPSEPFSTDGHWGTFSIVDETGIPYVTECRIKLNPIYSRGDWLILLEEGGGSKLSFIKRSGGENPVYTMNDDLFKTMNGFGIPGKPIGLVRSMAKNVGPMGSTTIMTDEVAYVINNMDIRKVSELKDEFLDGTPDNFNVVARKDCEAESQFEANKNYTYVATRDGRLFRRAMSNNFLGGAFLAEPYFVDTNGYKVVKFGCIPPGKNDNLPCYDEKNRRILFGVFKSGFTFKIVDGRPVVFNYFQHYMVPLLRGTAGDNIPPVWNMPEGTEVLHLTKSLYVGSNYSYTIFYNDKVGNTYMGDFVTNADGTGCVKTDGQKIVPFPGGNLTKESLLLTSPVDESKNIIFYTKGSEVRFIDRAQREEQDYEFKKFNAKVTYIGYSGYTGEEYKKFFVGLEDGSIFIYDINNRRFPKLVKDFKISGKVVSMQEL